MRKSERPVRPLRLHLERAARLLSNLQIFVVVSESRCPRSLLEVANRLRQIRPVDEYRRRHHQRQAFFVVVVAVVAVMRRWSEAARHRVLRLPGLAGAAAQTLRWWPQVSHRHRRHRPSAATSIGSPGWTSARVHV